MRFFKLFVFFVGSTIYSGQIFADIWQSTFSSYASEDYSINPAMLPGSSTGVWLSTLAPSYTLNKTDGNNELKAIGRLTAVESSNTALSVDRIDPSVALNWLRKYETGSYGITTQYEQIATRTAPGVTSQFVVDSTQTLRTLSANWSKSFSEKDTLTAMGSYVSSDFNGGGFVNNVTQTANLNYSHNLSETVIPSLSLAYTEMIFPANQPAVNSLTPNQPNMSTLSPMLGVEWKISPRLDSNVRVGDSLSSMGNSAQFSSMVHYAAEQTNLSLNASYLTTPSGYGGFITTESISGGVTHELSEQNSLGVNISWNKNFTIIDNTYGTIDSWVQHKIDTFWTVKSHFTHSLIEGGGLSAASTNVIGVSLNYTGSQF